MPRNDSMETVQSIKQRFEIIGNDPKLNRAIEKAIQVAPTDISVLVIGKWGWKRKYSKDNSFSFTPKTRKIYCRELWRHS